ncbi:MAG TPA: plastocyanin [Ideonella sp.]|jgi:plastocyanin|nr:plastocyanin [Ideonella sp.]
MKQIRSLALPATLALLAAAVQAGPLELTVTDRDGKPAADVVVLVDSPNAPAPKPASAPVVISQQDLKFSPFLTVVPLGSTLRFVNKDSYDHHVRSTPSGPLSSMPSVEYFELRLDAANPPPANSGGYGGYDDYKPAATPERKKSGKTSADVKVEHAGPIGLGCHIHGSMRGQVYVSGTPWFGKTDANGVVRIEGLPDTAAADVTIWHPDQLADQPAVKVQLGTATTKASAQLNFTPRRRRT